MRKRLSEEEKARTPLYEDLVGYDQTVKSMETVIAAVMLYHKMDRRMAVCALRDYFQVEVAKEMDKAAKATEDRIAELLTKQAELNAGKGRGRK